MAFWCILLPIRSEVDEWRCPPILFPKGVDFQGKLFLTTKSFINLFFETSPEATLEKRRWSNCRHEVKKSHVQNIVSRKILNWEKVNQNHSNQLFSPQLYPIYVRYSNSFLREIFGICNMLYDTKVKLHIQITRRHLYALTARKMGLEFHMAVYKYKATFQVFLKVNNKSIDLRDTINEQ